MSDDRDATSPCSTRRSSRQHRGAPAGRYVMLAVTDTGVGMTEAVRRADLRAVLHDQGEGQGHGARALDGVRHRQAERRHDRGCTSEPGDGTRRSRSTCRVASRRRDQAAAASRAAAVSALGGTETVLLVEDEDGGARASSARRLQRHGYTVLEAATSRATRLRQRQAGQPIHLLLTDVVMPGIERPRAGASAARAQRPGLQGALHVRLHRRTRSTVRRGRRRRRIHPEAVHAARAAPKSPPRPRLPPALTSAAAHGVGATVFGNLPLRK